MLSGHPDKLFLNTIAQAHIKNIFIELFLFSFDKIIF